MRLLCFCLLAPAMSLASPTDRIDQRFMEAGVSGTFVLLDVTTDGWIIYNRAESERGTVPASTFKILNSLIALQTGVVDGADEVLPWDGTERSVKSWNRDHDMASAIRVSAVWFYQELARRIGAEAMEDWVRRVDYGNGEIGGGIDRFWLDGDLRISPIEQVEFLRRLAARDLPFNDAAMDTVHAITVMEQGDDWTLHAKTGWAIHVEPSLGWYVGWVDRGGRRRVFATRIEMTHADQARLRVELTRTILRDLNVLP